MALEGFPAIGEETQNCCASIEVDLPVILTIIFVKDGEEFGAFWDEIDSGGSEERS